MELVYLWVEEYKNIKNQGFNFSSRFKCKYIKESNELTIYNNDYTNIFPSHINVTAIVGENGSGKSTLLELIAFSRFERIQRILKNKKFFVVFENDNILYIPNFFVNSFHEFNSLDINVNNYTDFEIYEEKINVHNLYDLTMFTSDLNNFTDQSTSHNMLKNDHYESFYNGYNILYGKDIRDDTINQKEFNAKYMYINSKDENFFSFLDEKFLFKNMKIKLNVGKIINFNFVNDSDKNLFKEIEVFFLGGVGESLSDYKQKHGGDKFTDIYKKTQKFYLINKLFSYLLLKEYYKLIIDFSRDYKEEFKKDLLEDILKKITVTVNRGFEILRETKKGIIDKKALKTVIFLQIIDFLNKEFKEVDKFLLKLFKNKRGYLNQYLTYHSKHLKYFRHHQLFFKIIDKKFDLNDIKNEETLVSETILIDSNVINNYDKHIEQNKLFLDIYNSANMYIDFVHEKNDRYTFRNLSTGEKSFFKFLVNYVYTINNLSYSKNSIIFFDEIECSFHPKWQKRIFYILLKILNEKLFIKSSTKWQLIFLTHSPFLLSDIPKSNVLFLKNGAEYDKDFESETFGANIHTLLADGFFMDNGFMGEFAKLKIEQVYNFITKKDTQYIKSKEEAQNIIDIVGEPLIKKQLQKLFDDTFNFNELTIDQEIELLEVKLKALRKIKND